MRKEVTYLSSSGWHWNYSTGNVLRCMSCFVLEGVPRVGPPVQTKSAHRHWRVSSASYRKCPEPFSGTPERSKWSRCSRADSWRCGWRYRREWRCHFPPLQDTEKPQWRKSFLIIFLTIAQPLHHIKNTYTIHIHYMQYSSEIIMLLLCVTMWNYSMGKTVTVTEEINSRKVGQIQ